MLSRSLGYSSALRAEADSISTPNRVRRARYSLFVFLQSNVISPFPRIVDIKEQCK
jgi:hypothetical protein